MNRWLVCGLSAQVAGLGLAILTPGRPEFGDALAYALIGFGIAMIHLRWAPELANQIKEQEPQDER